MRKFGESTYCSDPNATHQITSHDAVAGYGIAGYYCSEIEAHAVVKRLRAHGSTTCTVEPYDPAAPVVPGVHPLIAAHWDMGAQ